MASAEQYAAWIAANANKQGTPEFETVATAYKAARAGMAGPSPAAQEGSQAPQAPAPIPTQPSPNSEGSSRLSDFTTGLGGSAIKTVLGIKQIFADHSPDDRLALAELEKDMKSRSGWADAGNVAGEIAQFAMPGAKIAANSAKAVNALKVLKNFDLTRKALSVVLPGATASAAQEFLAPVEGEGNATSENKLKGAGLAGLTGAAANSILGLGGKVLTKAFTPKYDAQVLMDHGIQPNLAEGADNWLTRAFAKMTSGVTKPLEHQMPDVASALARNSTPEAVLKGVHPDQLVDHILHYFDTETKKALKGGVFNLSENARTTVSNAGRDLDGSLATQFQKTVHDIMGDARTLTPEEVVTISKRLSDQADKWISKADASGEILGQRFNSALAAFKTHVRDSKLSSDSAARMKALDTQWADAGKIVDAVKAGKSATRENIPPNKILDQYLKDPALIGESGSKSKLLLDTVARTIGKTDSNDQFRAAMNMAKNVSLGALAYTNPILAAPIGVSALGQSKAGAKFLFGGNDWQKSMADKLRKGFDVKDPEFVNALRFNKPENFNAELLKSPLAETIPKKISAAERKDIAREAFNNAFGSNASQDVIDSQVKKEVSKQVRARNKEVKQSLSIQEMKKYAEAIRKTGTSNYNARDLSSPLGAYIYGENK